MADKLYVVVRGDLSPGLQIAQSCHAALLYAFEHPESCGRWFRDSNYICNLSVSDEHALARLLESASDAGLVASGFREPDLGYSLTAIALEPGRASRLCKRLKLALSGLHQCNMNTTRRNAHA